MSSPNDGSRLTRRSLVKGAAGLGAATIALKSTNSAFASGGSAPAVLKFGRQSNTEIIFSHIWVRLPARKSPPISTQPIC